MCIVACVSDYTLGPSFTILCIQRGVDQLLYRSLQEMCVCVDVVEASVPNDGVVSIRSGSKNG